MASHAKLRRETIGGYEPIFSPDGSVPVFTPDGPTYKGAFGSFGVDDTSLRSRLEQEVTMRLEAEYKFKIDKLEKQVKDLEAKLKAEQTQRQQLEKQLQSK